MYNFSVIFLVAGFFIIIFTIVILIYYATYPKSSTSGNVGTTCGQTADCNIGLYCNGNICVIPKNGSCNNNESFCVTGSKCINGECTLLTKDKCSNQKVLDQIQLFYSSIYISRDPNSIGIKLPISDQFIDLFFYNGVIFLLDTSGMIINSYDPEGNFIRSFNLNVKSSFLEVYNGKIYTIFNNNLYSSEIPKLMNSEFNFINNNLSENIYSIKSDYTMTKLAKNIDSKIIPGPGIEELIISSDKIIQTLPNGIKQTVDFSSFKFPFLYNSKIYFSNLAVKSYEKNDKSYSIFLYMK